MKPDYEKLFKIAETQHGYFTTYQASKAGYSRKDVSSLTKRNKFVRVFHGIYRITHYPASENEDLMAAVLKCGPQAVISHDTALAVYQLSDVMPGTIHITIPKNRSRRQKGIKYHTSRIAPQETTTFNGLPITTVERSITDVIRNGMDATLIKQAIKQAIKRGMITSSSLMKQASQYGEKTRDEVKNFLGR